MKLLEHWRKFYYKSCSDFLNNKKNEKYAYFRYFASFWVHAIQKQMFEINGFKIEKSVLTDEFIGRNKFEVIKQTIKLSGIDGYAIYAYIC